MLSMGRVASCSGAGSTSVAPGRVRGLRELSILAVLYVGYTATRTFADQDLRSARSRAETLLDVENWMGLGVESWLNQRVSGIAWLGAGMSFWYAALHYLVTPIALYWLYRRSPTRYGRARTALVIASALGLVGYLLVPTAPPRLMPSGFVDTLARNAHVGWWSQHASAPDGLGQLTNELAAMPSLHVGWAVWVAWALYPLLGRVGRLLVVLYAVGTTIVVVATGNHWVLDAVAGAVVVWFGIAAVRLHAARSSRRAESTTTTANAS